MLKFFHNATRCHSIGGHSASEKVLAIDLSLSSITYHLIQQDELNNRGLVHKLHFHLGPMLKFFHNVTRCQSIGGHSASEKVLAIDLSLSSITYHLIEQDELNNR